MCPSEVHGFVCSTSQFFVYEYSIVQILDDFSFCVISLSLSFSLSLSRYIYIAADGVSIIYVGINVYMQTQI